ncbi:MAG TPA: nucleotidyltransferase domain-containing protein [Polyangiaceae bacterium]|nr:nucleotidyltransferase domain-containing protein [Polyangiaceae bacterium]
MPDVVATLREILGRHPEVDLAILFGSAAKGALRKDSDVDLALRATLGREARNAMLAEIERALGRTLDVVDIDAAPPLLRFEIARDGVVLLERTPGALTVFRARAYVDWFDFAPIARMVHRRALERLRGPT